MPYVRCGKCVYKGKTCENKGEKVGCSETPEKAKKYLKKLRMETAHESTIRDKTMITKSRLRQIIQEEMRSVLHE